MSHVTEPNILPDRSRRPNNPCALFAIIFALALTARNAEAATPATISAMVIDPQRIFALFFLMLGPIKVLAPFVEMTRHADSRARRRLASHAILLSAVALLLAGALGDNMVENFGIPLPVLALAGGLILFVVALNTVFEQFSPPTAPAQFEANPQEFGSAVARLTYPVVVTPWGIAILIVFAALAKNDPETLIAIAGIALVILVLDWFAMLFAEEILRWARLPLQLFAVILGVIQVALGLQLILRGLSLSGIPILSES